MIILQICNVLVEGNEAILYVHVPTVMNAIYMRVAILPMFKTDSQYMPSTGERARDGRHPVKTCPLYVLNALRYNYGPPRRCSDKDGVPQSPHLSFYPLYKEVKELEPRGYGRDVGVHD